MLYILIDLFYTSLYIFLFLHRPSGVCRRSRGSHYHRGCFFRTILLRRLDHTQRFCKSKSCHGLDKILRKKFRWYLSSRSITWQCTFNKKTIGDIFLTCTCNVFFKLQISNLKLVLECYPCFTNKNYLIIFGKMWVDLKVNSWDTTKSII